MFGMNFGKKDVSEKAKADLIAYCEKHGTTDIKALLMSEENGEEGLKIMYKHIPGPMKLMLSEKNFLSFMKENKEMIFAQLPENMIIDMDELKKKG